MTTPDLKRERIIEVSTPITTPAVLAAIVTELRVALDHLPIRTFSDIESLDAAANAVSAALGSQEYADITQSGSFTLASGPDGRS